MRTARISGSRLSSWPGCTYNKRRFKIKIGELTLAELTQTSSCPGISSSLHMSRICFSSGALHTFLILHESLSAINVNKSHCNARLLAVKVWDIIENRACAAVVHGFSKPRTTFECIYTNTFTSKVSRGLDKPIPKPLGQDKPRLELALG